MARNELVVAAAPEVVWDVLSDPAAYGDWVVGADAILGWDDTWPRRGAWLEHRAGRRPASVQDRTEVLASAPSRRLELRARGRPLGAARVEVCLAPHPAGTLVTLVEDPDGISARVLPLGDLFLRLRNGESLRRLRALAERRARPVP